MTVTGAGGAVARETIASAGPAVSRVTDATLREPANATWSNALRIGDELFISGQTAHPASRIAAEGGTAMCAYEQATAVLQKIEALAQAAGGSAHNIVKLVVYLTEIGDKDEVGRARRDFFAHRQAVYPASTLVGVAALVFPELKVEIDAVLRLDVDLRKAV